MTNALEREIERAARQFAEGVIAIIRASDVRDLVGLAGRATTRTRRDVAVRSAGASRGRAGRRGSADLGSRALEVLAAAGSRVTSEELRRRLGSPAKPAYQYTMTKLVRTGQVRKAGERRATTYRLV